jgi:glycosyltransferase involved in cell wall biosynthesis
MNAGLQSDNPSQAASAIDLSLVIPCLNEERNIVATLDNVVAAMAELPYTYEVLVVDDGSTDGTAALVSRYCEAHPGLPIRLHKHPRNRGLSRSYLDGAFLCHGKYYRMVCGDNAEPKDTLITTLQHLGKADMILSYHDPLTGKPLLRRALSHIYTALVNWISGYRIVYYNGCAVHLRYNVMRWGPYSFGFGFQAELITRLLDEGATHLEVPVAATHREESGLGPALNVKNFLSVGHTLVELLIRRLRKRAFGEFKP